VLTKGKWRKSGESDYGEKKKGRRDGCFLRFSEQKSEGGEYLISTERGWVSLKPRPGTKGGKLRRLFYQRGGGRRALWTRAAKKEKRRGSYFSFGKVGASPSERGGGG